MFPIQGILKESQNSLDEQTLMSQDISFALNFKRQTQEFHEMLKTKQDQFNDGLYNA